MLHSPLVDQLGRLKAERAALELRERELVTQLQQELLKAGEPAAEGHLFRATFTVAERVSIDSAAVHARYPRALFPELYRSSLVETLRVTARTGFPLREVA